MEKNTREKLVNELERVIQCREVARCQWRAFPPKTQEHEKLRMESLLMFNEVIQMLKNALVNKSGADELTLAGHIRAMAVQVDALNKAWAALGAPDEPLDKMAGGTA